MQSAILELSYLRQQFRPRILWIQLRQLAQNFLGALVLHPGHDHLYLDDLVSTHAFPRRARHTLLTQPQFLSGLRPRRNLQLRPSAAVMRVDGGHVDLRAQRGFANRNRNRYMDIIAHACEHGMRPYLDDQVQVAGGTAFGARVALAREPYSLAVAGACLDAELQRLTFRHHALAIAGRASVLHFARAVAARTLDVELHPAAHLRHLAGAVALRTLDATASGRLALAARTGFLPLNLQPRHASAHRRPEVHAYLVLQEPK